MVISFREVWTLFPSPSLSWTTFLPLLLHPVQFEILPWKGAVPGQFNKFIGDFSIPLRHDLQPFLSLAGRPASEIFKSPLCFLLSFSGLFLGSSVSNVIRCPNAPLCYFLHTCWDHAGPLALGCSSLIAHTLGLRLYLVSSSLGYVKSNHN